LGQRVPKKKTKKIEGKTIFSIFSGEEIEGEDEEYDLPYGEEEDIEGEGEYFCL
jgi:hypothetical protein